MKELNLQNSHSGAKVSKMAVFICVLGALFYCYEYFLRISPSVMSQQLINYYKLDAGAFGNLTAFYYYAYTPMQLLVGVFMDRYGPRFLLSLSCFLCAIGTYMFAAGYSLFLAEMGRLLVGFGSAFAFVGALKLATIWLPHKRFAMFSGMIIALGMLGAALGDMSLTTMTAAFGWMMTLQLAAAFGIILASMIYFIVRDEHNMVGKEIVETDHVNYSEVFSRLWVACKHSTIWINGIIGCLLYIPLSGFAELWGIPFLKQGHGFSPEDAALAISMVFIGWAVGGPVFGWLSDLIRRRNLPITLGAIASAIVIFAVIRLPAGTPHIWINVLLFLFGVFSSVQILTFSVGWEAAGVTIPGTAIAFTNMLVMIGGVLLQPLIGHLLDNDWVGHTVNGAQHFSLGNYQHALMVIPVGIVIAVVLSLLMKETHCEIGEDE